MSATTSPETLAAFPLSDGREVLAVEVAGMGAEVHEVQADGSVLVLARWGSCAGAVADALERAGWAHAVGSRDVHEVMQREALLAQVGTMPDPRA